MYAGIGYAFADRLEVATSYVTRFGDMLALGIGLPLTIYIGWRAAVLIRMVRELRLRRLTPSQLQQKLNGNQKIAVIDLLNFEEGEPLDGISGAIRIDPKRLRSRTHVIVPQDLEIVIYCTSNRELTSARVAVSLQKKGMPKVSILDGGLDAWKKEGFPVSPVPASSREAIERFGIQILDQETPRTPLLRKYLSRSTLPNIEKDTINS
jgi:rhodanese-related sulfurtransferase